MNQDNGKSKENGSVADRSAPYSSEKNVSEAELARRMNISRQAVNKILNGYSDPPVSRVFDMAEALGISPKELFPE